MKRKDAEWGKPLGSAELDEIRKRLARITKEGVQHEILYLNANTIILHFKTSKYWAEKVFDRFSEQMRHLKEKLPENCFALVTPDEVNLRIHRPNSNLEVRLKNLEDQFKSLEDQFAAVNRLAHQYTKGE